MRILFTISYYTPYVSGLTIHTQRVAETLAKRNHTVYVLTTQHLKKLPRREVHKNVSIARVPYLLKISKGFFMPTYVFATFRLVKQNDVIIINLPQAEGFIAALIGRLLGKRVYCIYHCEVAMPRNLPNLFIENILHLANGISLLLADKVITYTEDFAIHTKLLPFFSKKLSSIYPPIPLPIVNTEVKNEFQRQLPRNVQYRIGVAARIAAEKGVEYLLEAIPIIKKSLRGEFIILVAGPKNPAGEEAYWKTLTPLLTLYKRYFIFLGTLPFEKMGAFYSILDLLVLPSVNSTESFGMVQVEAMFAGVPVVASNLPGVRVPILKTGMGEIAQVKDPEDLANKIVTVLRHKQRYVKNRAEIEEHFSFSHSIDAYEKVFTRIS